MWGRTICLLISCPQIFMQQDGDTFITWCWAPFHFTITFVEILLLAQRAIFLNLLFKILFSLDHALSILFSFPRPPSLFLTQLYSPRPPTNHCSSHMWTPSPRTAPPFPETQNSDYTLKMVFSNAGQIYPSHLKGRNYFCNFDLILYYAYMLEIAAAINWGLGNLRDKKHHV